MQLNSLILVERLWHNNLSCRYGLFCTTTNSDLNSPCLAWHPYGKLGLFKTGLVIRLQALYDHYTTFEQQFCHRRYFFLLICASKCMALGQNFVPVRVGFCATEGRGLAVPAVQGYMFSEWASVVLWCTSYGPFCMRPPIYCFRMHGSTILCFIVIIGSALATRDEMLAMLNGVTGGRSLLHVLCVAMLGRYHFLWGVGLSISDRWSRRKWAITQICTPKKRFFI